uniref:Auxin responsive protein-like n=5 Tax=Oryza TaxID=4527 RepID=Q652J3_ORYSJ|nr:auxin responsive protein-like [Oryza sativa Japonica Group]BAD46274.1 auxin responsive protein-like [Oryza sativa Japonica Group]
MRPPGTFSLTDDAKRSRPDPTRSLTGRSVRVQPEKNRVLVKAPARPGPHLTGLLPLVPSGYSYEPTTSAASASAAGAAIAKPRREAAIMKRLLRRLSRVAAADACAAAAYQPLRADRTAKLSASSSSSLAGARRLGCGARVPEGHVPVCVGEEGGPVERYAVRTDLLGQPAFAALLRRAAQEYGYGHPGALRIPCPVADFHQLLLRLSAAAAGDGDDDDEDGGGLVYY